MGCAAGHRTVLGRCWAERHVTFHKATGTRAVRWAAWSGGLRGYDHRSPST